MFEPGSSIQNKSEYNFSEVQKSTIALVKIIERFPEVYSCNIDVYRSRFHIDLTWIKVYRAVRTELDVDCSLDELKAKWKALRSSFGRYVGRCHQNLVWGMDPPMKYYLADSLDFLLPHMRAKSGEHKFRQSFVTYDEGDDNTNEDDATNEDDITDEDDATNEDDITNEDDATNEDDTSDATLHMWSNPPVDLIDIFKEEPLDIVEEISFTGQIIPKVELTDPPPDKMKTAETETNDNENKNPQYFKCILPAIGHVSLQEETKSTIGLLPEPHHKSGEEKHFTEHIIIHKVDSTEPPAKKIRTDNKDTNDDQNKDLQFFKFILPDIAHFTQQQKIKLKMGILQLIDEIENNSNE